MFHFKEDSFSLRFIEISLYWLVILMFPLFFITYGLDFTDAPWNISMQYSPDFFMPYWLTIKIGSVWASIWDDSMISFRFLHYLLLELLIITFFLLLSKNHDKLLFSRGAFAAAIIIFSTSGNIFSYGTTTFLFTAILFISMNYFVHHNKLKYLIIGGAVTAMAMLSRFPNFVMIPMVVFLLSIFVIYKKNEEKLTQKRSMILLFKWTSVYFLSFLLCLGLFFILYVSPSNYINYTLNNLSTVTQSTHYHNLNSLFHSYLRDIIVIGKSLMVLSISYQVYKIFPTHTQIQRVTFTILLFLSYLIFLIYNNPGGFNLGFSLQITAFTLFIIGKFALGFKKEKQYTELLILLIACIFLFVPAIGSNTGLLKTKNLASLYLMFLLVWTYKKNREKPEFTRYILILTTVWVVFSVYTRGTWFYGDSGNLNELTYTINHEKLKYIKTTLERKQITETILNKINENDLSKSDIVFLGAAGQMFYYLLKKPFFSKQLFYLEIDDKQVINQLKTVILKDHKFPTIIVIKGYPNEKTWPQYLNKPNRKNTKQDSLRSIPLMKMLQETKYTKIFADNTFEIFH